MGLVREVIRKWLLTNKKETGSKEINLNKKHKGFWYW